MQCKTSTQHVKHARKYFLEEQAKKDERAELKKTLQWWVEILQGSDSITDMIAACNEETDVAEKTLHKNLNSAIKETTELERSYRSVALLLRTQESMKVKNVSVINVEPINWKILITHASSVRYV